MRRKRFAMLWAVTALATLGLVAPAGPAVAAPEFRVIEISAAGFDASGASALNDAGQIAGTIQRAPYRTSAFIWERTFGTRALASVGGEDTYASGINNRGDVVGSTQGFVYDPGDAVVWRGGGFPAVLGPPPGFAGATGNAINNVGEVGGNGAFGPQAARWTPTDEPRTIAPFGSSVHAINDGGQIVGYARFATYHHRPFLWNPRTGLRDLGTFAGENGSGIAYAVNNRGHVVGVADAPGFVTRAFLWRDGRLTAFGPDVTYPYGINERDDVVGQYLVRGAGGRFAYHAFLYRNGALRNLNDLIPAGSGIYLGSARDINNSGWIVANGTNAAGRQRAFLLIPTGPA